MGNSQSSGGGASSGRPTSTTTPTAVAPGSVAEAAAVDGGSSHPIQNHTVYPAIGDYDAGIVASLITCRRLAPFYEGRDEEEEEEEEVGEKNQLHQDSADKLNPTITTTATSASVVINQLASSSSFFTPPSSLPQSPIDNNSSNKPPQNLYSNSIECPICFLYYPKNINYTRCCNKPICTECFVQIKRSDLNTDPAECPFCVEPHMGIIYGPPPWAPPRSISAAATQSISSSRPLFSSLPTTPTSSHDQLHTLPHRSNTTRITGTVIDATPATAIVSSSTANQLNLASHPTASTTPTTTIVINTTQLVSNSDSSANAAVAVVPHPISTTTLNDTPRETATLAKNTITKTTATTSRRISTPHTSPNCVTSDQIRPTWIRRQQQLALAREASNTQRSRLAARITAAQASGRDIGSELTQAARAAASLAEIFAGAHHGGGGHHHRSSRNRSGGSGARRAIRSVLLQQGPSSSPSSSSQHNRSRSGGRGEGGLQQYQLSPPPGVQEYVAAMRGLGPDLEELMLMEAMRLSLLEAEQQQQQQQRMVEQEQMDEPVAATKEVDGNNNNNGEDDDDDDNRPLAQPSSSFSRKA